MALVGDNGAGKSTLVKCVAGTHAADSGRILFEGKEVHIHGPKDAAKLGIEVVYQDLALADNLDVVQNMFLGREVHDWFQRLKEPIMEQKTAETLKSLAVTTISSIRQPVATLSGGQRQSVAVAKAVQWNSKLVVLDEPTAALGVAQTEQVLALVRRLAEQALGIVFIVVFFSFKATNFFTANNFDNVIIQMAGTAMLAYGVVFVLLLGEIDLSISYVAGIGALTVAELQLAGSNHHINGLLAMLVAVAICAAIGGLQGSIVAFVGVPSFGVTLAGFLIWQGVILQVLEQPGSII